MSQYRLWVRFDVEANSQNGAQNAVWRAYLDDDEPPIAWRFDGAVIDLSIGDDE